MNKADIVNEIAKVVKTKKDAQAAMDCVLSSIAKALENGDSVSLLTRQLNKRTMLHKRCLDA